METTRWVAEGAGDGPPKTLEILIRGAQFRSSVSLGRERSGDQALGETYPPRTFEGQQVSDRIACTARSGPVLVLHVIWCGAWVTMNAGATRGIRPFDPFPFLTMTVSLEAIFLALFVLASQNGLTCQADKRSHFDLQIDLLAECEMTAVLQLLQDIAQHLTVETNVTPEQLGDLVKKTNLRRLTSSLGGTSEHATSSMRDESETSPEDLKAAS